MHVTRDHPPRHPLHAHNPPRHLFHARNPQPPAASPVLRAEPATTCRVTRFVHRTRDHPPRHPFCTQNPAPPTTSPVSRTEPATTCHITRFVHGTRHHPHTTRFPHRTWHHPPHHPFHARNPPRPAPSPLSCTEPASTRPVRPSPRRGMWVDKMHHYDTHCLAVSQTAPMHRRLGFHGHRVSHTEPPTSSHPLLFCQCTCNALPCPLILPTPS